MIWLVRHGETDHNRPPPRFQGHFDVPLNETGRKQARALAQQLAAADHRPVALYASPLVRALETAEIIGAALELEPVLDARLAESNRGSWEGRSFTDVEQAEPAAYAAWHAAGEGFRFPGGESLQEQMDRVTAALADIEQAHPRAPVLVVCHGGSIRVALCDARGTGLAAFHSWDVPNGALISL